MRLLDLFKKNAIPNSEPETDVEKLITPESQTRVYEPDPYYTDVVFAGTPFERKVITFEDRKKTTIPSKQGLYPAEILLLDYCSKGSYPKPKNRYPGFWWFTYGIHDVEAVLKTLEERGFIAFAPAKDSIKSFTVSQLKELLATKGQQTTGKKAELIERVTNSFSEEELLAASVPMKYVLTEIGEQELNENAYVPMSLICTATLIKQQKMIALDLLLMCGLSINCSAQMIRQTGKKLSKNSLRIFKKQELSSWMEIKGGR